MIRSLPQRIRHAAGRLRHKLLTRLAPQTLVTPDGEVGIALLGHRDYVGGLWEEMGSHQLAFLQAAGLQPQDGLLDIGCGSLRLGVRVIPFLEPGHYIGIDKEAGLIEAALASELDADLVQERRPILLVSDSFDFALACERAARRPNWAMAQSLFTHLPSQLINTCFARLAPVLETGGCFYATYFEADRPVRNPRRSRDHYGFRYTRAEMLNFGERHGFEAHYIGDWGHPRGQVIVRYINA